MASTIYDGTTNQHFVEEINHNEIKQIQVVGNGSFGVVYKGLWRNRTVAVKYISSEQERKEFTREVRQLSRVSHPNIVQLYGACTQGPHVCLVMEYAEGGSLYNVLHNNIGLCYTLVHAMSWAKQCAEGVAYLHSLHPKPLIHRDLKPPNLLLVDNGRKIKICDFGTAAEIATYMTNNKGSAAWMAPEVFEGSSYSEKCDVFSWGVILWEVLSRQKPFDDLGTSYRIMWAVHQGRRPPLIEACPPPIERLMTQCWQKLPNDRPSMQSVVNTMQTLCDLLPQCDLSIDYIEHNDGDIESYTRQPPTNTDTYTDSQWSNNDLDESNETLYSSNNSSHGISLVSSRVDKLNNIMSNRSPIQHTVGIMPHSKTPSAAACQRIRQINIPGAFRDMSDAKSSKNIPPTNNVNCLENSQFNRRQACDCRTDINPRLQTPLQIHVNPNAWDLPESRSVLEREGEPIKGNMKTMPGLDKFILESLEYTGNSSQSTTEQTQHLSQTGVSSLEPENVHLMLDPHLRPISPDPNDDTSKQIFEEHKILAKEYLKVQTELAYMSQRKNELESKMDDDMLQQKRDIIQLENEKESLITLYKSLKNQLNLNKDEKNIRE